MLSLVIRDTLVAMKRALALLILASGALAQPVLTVTGPGTVQAGGTATLTVAVTGAATANVPAIQWTLAMPAGFTLGAAALTSSDPAGSIAACGPSACLVAGSATPLVDGNIVTIPLAVALSAKAGATPLPVTGLLAATVTASPVNPALGTPYSIVVVPNPCDVNGDGAINVADVQAAINGDSGTAACPIAAANGGCTVVTIQQIVIAATGGACKIP